MNQIVSIEQSVYGTKDSFVSVLTDRSINFDREAEFALQTLYGNDYAMKIAMQNRRRSLPPSSTLQPLASASTRRRSRPTSCRATAKSASTSATWA